MKSRLLALLFAALTLSAFAAAAADKPEPNPTVTTTKRSAVKVGNSFFALVKGTKLEVLGRDGKDLIVKYRASQGKIPYADTDYVLSDDEKAEEEAAAEAATAPAAAKPVAPPVAKKAAPPVAAKTPPPALATDGKPATNYGKAVQKAKQAEQAHKGKLVSPTDEILDEKPKK
ncbi:MAG: hypothetical protein HYX71_00850 [Opitutae bacterium]|nr:hypothetical protein [Opitutae bacterium]